jgi:UDP-N-acetyl-2-amino-2-deoxyglucuronate dehydrogenase
VICEKPLVINPWNLDPLQELERETGKTISTVLQLRVHPALIALKSRLDMLPHDQHHDVVLTYVTARGYWYAASWKGLEERSGGLATNIGIHLFDLLLWLFGGVVRSEVHLKEQRRMAGFLELKRANVRWFLSTDVGDLPFAAEGGSKTTYRSIVLDGTELEFTEGFADLHTRVYQRVLAGEGFGISEARPSIELVYQIRHSPAAKASGEMHPYLLAGLSHAKGKGEGL